jgi:serine/threonine-protein kinase
MSSWNLSEGDLITHDRYAVSLLGGGRRYEAYLAWDDDLHALVVVKVLRPHLAEDPTTQRGLAREATALRTLSHPFLVRGFDAVLEGPRPHVVLEFTDGPRLSTLVRRYGVSVDQLLPLALNVCSVLHHLSGRGWLHLDIKPSNLIMGALPRVIDLSVARRMDDLGDVVSPIGTEGYMAPEQADLRRLGELGPATDVWGLGATMHHALSGSPPGPTPPALPSRVPHPVAELVQACLEARPSDRPSAAQVAERLEALVAGLPRPRLGPMRPGHTRRMSALGLR